MPPGAEELLPPVDDVVAALGDESLRAHYRSEDLLLHLAPPPCTTLGPRSTTTDEHGYQLRDPTTGNLHGTVAVHHFANEASASARMEEIFGAIQECKNLEASFAEYLAVEELEVPAGAFTMSETTEAFGQQCWGWTQTGSVLTFMLLPDDSGSEVCETVLQLAN